MARDNRQIHLDPMEWRDAMKDVAKPSKKKAPATATRKPRKAPAKKP
jgi:hypothetical protein